MVDMQLRTLGASLAGNVTDWMSVGITVGFNQLDYVAETTLIQPDLEEFFPGLLPQSVLDFFAPHIGKPINRVRTDGDDQQASVFAGVLFTPGPKFSLGFAYKSQPKFDYDYAIEDSVDFELLEPVPGSSEFNVPDSYGMGLSFRPTDLFILSVEARRVLYSDLVDPLINFYEFSGDTSGRTQTIGDVTQYHVGFEYLFVNFATPVSLRLGYWFEPYHALVNDYLDTQLQFGFTDEDGDFVQGIRATGFLRQFEEDQNHITFGLGLSFGRNWVVDASADIADSTAQYSLSSIYRF
jgi:long-subunit fatty acid transport protein